MRCLPIRACRRICAPVMALALVATMADTPVRAQSSPCGLLGLMREADSRLARPGATPGDTAALLRAIRADGLALAARGARGIDAAFVDAFVAPRATALAAVEAGVPRAEALADPAMVATTTRLTRLVEALDCTRAGAAVKGATTRDAVPVASRAPASVAAPLPEQTQPGARKAGLDGEGRGRFVPPGSLGETQWRIAGDPTVWGVLSVFLLAFSAAVVLLNWMRRVRHRRAQRFPCALDLQLRNDDGARAARLVDLSHVGGKLRMTEPPKRGEKVTVDWQGHQISARVVWANRHFAGLDFVQALDDDVYADLLAAGHTDPPWPVHLGKTAPAFVSVRTRAIDFTSVPGKPSSRASENPAGARPIA